MVNSKYSVNLALRKSVNSVKVVINQVYLIAQEMLRKLSRIHENYLKQNNDSNKRNELCPSPAICSPPDSPAPAIRSRNRLMSVENTLSEVITLYEKLKKGRDSGFRSSQSLSEDLTEDIVNDDNAIRINMELNEAAAETEPTVPSFNNSTGLNFEHPKLRNIVQELNEFKNFKSSKYLYFSESTGLLQSEKIEALDGNGGENFSYSELFTNKKNYWLNIMDPDELDLSLLCNSFKVNDLTISDIRERITEEKMEVYKHFTFFSLRLMNLMEENSRSSKVKTQTQDGDDVNFNILLFRDFVITIHCRAWPNITDMLSFLNRLAQSNNLLTPDWVLLSCFIEMSQDAKNFIDLIEPEINNIRVGCKTLEMSDIMRRNFDMELRVYSISRFIKPKMRILRMIKTRCSKRLNKIVTRLLQDIHDEFREQQQDLRHFNHVLERSQDTFMAIVTSDQSREANEMNLIMKRISEFALIFLPIQAIAGLMGMNCFVPFQADKYPTQKYFWFIVALCTLLGLVMYVLRHCVFAKSKK